MVDNIIFAFKVNISIKGNTWFKGRLFHKGGIVLQDCDAKVGVKLLTPFLF